MSAYRFFTQVPIKVNRGRYLQSLTRNIGKTNFIEYKIDFIAFCVYIIRLLLSVGTVIAELSSLLHFLNIKLS